MKSAEEWVIEWTKIVAQSPREAAPSPVEIIRAIQADALTALARIEGRVVPELPEGCAIMSNELMQNMDTDPIIYKAVIGQSRPIKLYVESFWQWGMGITPTAAITAALAKIERRG